MRTWKRILMLALVAALLLFAVAVVAALALDPAAPAANSVTWQVVASGGQTMSSASYTMMSTAGQPVAGQVSGDNYPPAERLLAKLPGGRSLRPAAVYCR
ncbi:MAG: hypothetical protein IPM60_15385 [Rhodospirillales bacterium]|nr:hypothetical protein [Rhodospirillales bacterium]